MNNLKQMKKNSPGEVQQQKTVIGKLRSRKWTIRKETYEQFLQNILKCEDANDVFKIDEQMFKVKDLVAYFEDLPDEDHPSVLLVGLQCVEELLKRQLCSGRHFVKLMDQGIEKYPLRLNKRQQIIEKFADIMEAAAVEPSLLNHKLSHPNEKCVMFVLEMIGFLGYHQLAKRVKKLSQQHSKQCVRELGGQIYEQLSAGCQPQPQQPTKVLKTTASMATKKAKREDDKVRVKSDIIEKKIPNYHQLSPKQQQGFSSQLLQIAQKLDGYSTSQLSSLAHTLRLMIEDNNHITSTNGLKILTILIRNQSAHLPRSYPLLLMFSKCKLHETHPINAIVYELAETILRSTRIADLLQAIIDGSSSTKANVRYGCTVVFVRAVLILSQQQSLYTQLHQTQYIPINEASTVRAKYSKQLSKCYECLAGDKKYSPLLTPVKPFLTYQLNSTQQSTKQKLQNKPQVQSRTKTKQQLKPSPKQKKHYKIINPQDKMNLILNTIEASRMKEARKLISQSLAECEMCVDEGRFQLYYFCEILEYFVTRYVADDSTAEMVSSYVTQYLTIVTRGTHSVDVESIQYVLNLCLGKLALGRQLVGVLDNLVGRNSLRMIVGVMGKLNTKVKKKNRCILVEWLYGNVGTDDMDDNFDLLIKKIEQGQVLYQPKQQSSTQKHPYIANHPQQQSSQDYPYITHHSPQQSNQRFVKQEQSRQQSSGKSKQMEVQPSCTLQNLQLSKISHHENEENVDAKWQYFLHKHCPKESSPSAHSLHMQAHVDDEGSKGDGSEDGEECENKQQQSVGNVEHYKQYIRKIRQSYLPKQYLQQKQQKQQQEPHQQSFQQQSPEQKYEQQPHLNDEQKSEQAYEQAQQQLEQPIEMGEKYSVLNEKKISYMLQNSTNPYTHLRNQIIVGLKNQPRKNIFLEELLTFMQNQPAIKKPPIYDAFVLVIVLLFAEIRENKALIGPLQNLYQFMASVHSTDRFLSCIFTHLHRVMEQTATASRQFLIKILTKSISRLMPFAQEPVQLLRDLCQFYSIGQNVYFEMYEKQYQTILSSIQDEPLGEVVEKALIEEGQHLTVIVQGWFQTRLKQRVQSYMNEIINDES